MEGGRRRSKTKNVVEEGSVWESRMKSDEGKGGIKVFNAEEKKPEENGGKRLRPKQSQIGANGKRTTTGKADISDGFEQNPIQISRQRSEPRKELDQQCKELSVSPGGTKTPAQKIKKTRSEVGKGISGSVYGIESKPTRIRKSKSESLTLICQSDGEVGNGDEIERNSIEKMKTRSGEIKEMSASVDGSESNPVPIRTLKSESLKLICQSDVESGHGDGTETNVNQLRKVKSESNRDVGESVNGRNSVPLSKVKSMPVEVLDDGNERSSTELKAAKSEGNKGESVEETEKSPVGNEKSGGDELCKEFGVCEEKVVSCGLSNLGLVKSGPEMEVDVEEEEEEEEEEVDDADDDDDEDEDWEEECDEEVDEEIEIDDVEKKEVEVKKIDIIKEEKPKKVASEEKKVQEVQEKTPPNSSTVKKQVPSVVNHSRVPPIPTKTKSSFVAPAANGFQRTPEANAGFQRAPETNAGFQRAPQTHNKLQSLVDLVMWRDVSKSAFIFGLGTFITVSLSYTKDLNISFITVISYLGLVYLAAIFLFRSIIRRGVIDGDYTSQDYVVGEEEAMWLLKMVLPYLNEFLLKLRALFSGDPATTMKLAVLLFVLARCGSSITIWKMAKLGFFGVFTVPRICSSYSTQLSNYGNFWVRRFKDAWETCSHKKAVAFGIFTLVWNLSSVMARIWAVFMLYVAFRYYQQSLPTDSSWVEEEPKCETTWQDPIGERRRGRRTATVDVRKEKKRF